MLVLIDCIGYPSNTIPSELIDYIKQIGLIQEVRAVAFKSLANNHQTIARLTHSGNVLDLQPQELHINPVLSNSLFLFWLVMNQQTKFKSYKFSDLLVDLQKVTLKVEFINFIQEYCDKIFTECCLAANQYFDLAVFLDTIKLVEQYYQLDDDLKMVIEKQQKPKM